MPLKRLFVSIQQKRVVPTNSGWLQAPATNCLKYLQVLARMSEPFVFGLATNGHQLRFMPSRFRENICFWHPFTTRSPSRRRNNLGAEYRQV